MSAGYIIEVRFGRAKQRWVLMLNGSVTSDRSAARRFATRKDADAVLALHRHTLPRCRWEVVEADANHALPLSRPG